MTKSNFSRNLQYYRRKAGLTQAQLADKLPCYVGTIARWERGARSPSLYGLGCLARALGVTESDLLERRNEDGK